ncbi:GIDE domain-containing protein [Streptomyces sp. NPDC047315]|uniref:GIDE domain-containing protein n=1 Tax=Streptomyces sp. NPDC047315 TaxID=3155142 RepID=UPI0033CABD87
MIFIQFISQFVVVGGLVLLVRALLEHRKLSTIDKARPVTVAELAADRPPGEGLRCAVEGSAEPGTAGLMTAPLSGQPCVWYQVTTREKWRTVTKDEGREISTRHDKVRGRTGSPPQFCVRDATGVAVVNFAGTDVDEPVQSFTRTRPARSQDAELPPVPVKLDGSDKLDHEVTWREVIVPPGQSMCVLGRGARHPETGHVVLGPPDTGRFIVSTLSHDELRTRSSALRKSRYTLGGWLFVGGATVFTLIELLANPSS